MTTLKKIINKIVIIGIMIGEWCSKTWSNIRWRKYRDDMPLDSADLKGPLTIKDYAAWTIAKVYSFFKYKPDGLSELGDSFRPAPYAYSLLCQARKGEIKAFEDDCDGFAGCVLHMLVKNGIDACIVSIISSVNSYGHAVVGYKDEDGAMHILDYLTDYKGKTIEHILKKHYMKPTGGKFVVAFKRWNYDEKKWTLDKKHIFFE